jgi:hypothetical protein
VDLERAFKLCIFWAENELDAGDKEERIRISEERTDEEDPRDAVWFVLLLEGELAACAQSKGQLTLGLSGLSKVD